MTQRSRIERKRDRKKLDILRSAAAAFRERGFGGTSMEQIAGALEMTKGSLYYYFKNKQEILYFTQEYALDRMLSVAGRITRTKLRADARLDLMIRAQMVLMLEELAATAAHIEFSALSPDLLERIVARRDEYQAKMKTMIDDGVRQGVFEAPDSKVAALAILGAINWSVRWYRPTGPTPVRDLAAQFARILVRGLMARSRTAEAAKPALLDEVLR